MSNLKKIFDLNHPEKIVYKALIKITLRPSILDPQGKATHHALQSLGYDSVESVRIGKLVEIAIDETERASAERIAREACEKLLANPVMENFEIELEEVSVQKPVSTT